MGESVEWKRGSNRAVGEAYMVRGVGGKLAVTVRGNE